MTIKTILTEPNKILRQVSKPVDFVGENERPAFLSQANYLSQAWSCPKLIAKGKHHFHILDDLKNERSRLVNLLTKIQ